MACQCHGEQTDVMPFETLPASLMMSGNEGLTLFIRGVQTGMQIRAAEQAKWQRLGVILALTFGVLTFAKHFGLSE